MPSCLQWASVILHHVATEDLTPETYSVCFPECAAGVTVAIEGEWSRLCARYLPMAPPGSVWRYHRAPDPHQPEQGWKLHISATVLNANMVLERVAPFLSGRGVQFKAPATLTELMRINSGLHHGYSQVGKFITVYPAETDEAVSLARRLHALTYGMSAPVVPFDLRFREGSNVYYRYGAFKYMEVELPDGRRAPAIRDPEGDLVTDLRESPDGRPAWVRDLFPGRQRRCVTGLMESPLRTTFRVFRALTQRGKGGVYQALDLSARPPRFCVLKEGRQHGELSWDGRDGRWRVRHEERALRRLRASGIEVPRVYSSFESGGNYYLVTEFIEGESLQARLLRMRKRLSISRVIRYGVELSAIVSRLHAAGWLWRDCKPPNIIVTKEGVLRPLDFEGACPVDRPDPAPWGTPAFAPPERHDGSGIRPSAADDLYALGAVLYFLLTGRPPGVPHRIPVAKLRRNVPAPVISIVNELLDPSPRRRPAALDVARRLEAAAAAH